MRWRALIAAGVLVGVTVIAASAAPAGAQSDPLGCESDVFDPAGILTGARLANPIRATEEELGATLHVRAEGVVDGLLADRMRQLRAQCAGWEVDGDLAPDLLVVMFSPRERDAAVYYGRDLSIDLDRRWERALDAMTENFPSSQWAPGVRAGLRELRTDRSGGDAGPGRNTVFPVTDDIVPPDESGASRDGETDVSAVLILFFAVIAIGSLIARYVFGWEGGASGGDNDGSGWGSGSSGSSHGWLGSSFGSSHHSGSSGSQSSSGSSHSGGQSGGGSKRW